MAVVSGARDEFVFYVAWGLWLHHGECGIETGKYGIGTGKYGNRTGEYGVGTGEYGIRTGVYGIGTGEYGSCENELPELTADERKPCTCCIKTLHIQF